MKISWAVFKFGYEVQVTEAPVPVSNMLYLIASGFNTERQAKKYVQHPDNLNQGSFIILEVIEVLRKK